MRRKVVIFVVAAIIAAFTWSQLAGFQRSVIVLKNARGMPIRVVIYQPRPPHPSRLSAVVVCPPMNSPPEAGQALILEFARRGMLVAAFDFRGAAPGENRALLRENVLGVTALDAAALLAYLASRPDVDRERVGLIGHSAGGTLAIRAAMEQPWVRATVAVGIAGDVTKSVPQNLLWLVGLYDEFRPLSEMQEVLEASNVEGIAEIERTAGSFSNGTARRLDVTATADHFTEFLNHGTALRAVEWFESAFAGRAAPRPRIAFGPWFLASYSIAFLSGWLLLVRRLKSTRTTSFALAAVVVILIVLPIPPLALFRADLALWGLALLISVNGNPGESGAGRLILLGWLSFVLTLIVNQTAYFWRYPHLLLGLPAFPFWHATGLLNQYLFIYPRGLLFGAYTSAVLHPGWLFWLLLAAEVARPGVLLGSIKALAKRRVPAGPRKRNWLAWAAAALLFAALSAIVAMRAAQGFVDRESLRLAGWVILRFAVLPFFIFALLRRLARRPGGPAPDPEARGQRT